MSPCKYCRGEVEFCDRCKRRFRESVSDEKCERIAFGSEREDFERMKKDLEELVDKKETVILSHKQRPKLPNKNQLMLLHHFLELMLKLLITMEI